MNYTVILIMFIFIAVMLLWMGFVHIYFLVTALKDKRIEEQDCTGGQAKFAEYDYEHSETEDYKKFLDELKPFNSELEFKLNYYCHLHSELNWSPHSTTSCFEGCYEYTKEKDDQIVRGLLDGSINIADLSQERRIWNSYYSYAFRFVRWYCEHNNDFSEYQKLCDLLEKDINDCPCKACKNSLIRHFINHASYKPYIEYLNTKEKDV